jgi:hypothetical protein
VQIVDIEYRFHQKLVPAFLPHPPNTVVSLHPTGKEHGWAVTIAFMDIREQSTLAKFGRYDNQIRTPLFNLVSSPVSTAVMNHKMRTVFEIIPGLLGETPVWIEN